MLIYKSITYLLTNIFKQNTMTNKIFRSFFAVATLLGVALGFASCETEGDGVVGDPTVDVSASTLNFAMGEGEQIVNVTSNSEWKVDAGSADWLTVTPMHGKGNKSITIAVAENTTGELRETTIKVIALHAVYGEWDVEKITISQSATDTPTVTAELLYGDNFDGEEATESYGPSNTSWPWIEQFPEFANAVGPASDNVTYVGKGTTIRSNSTSSSNYSDYAGSGMNNIFFGSNAYFQINNISLDAAQKNYKLTFGTEKYSQTYGSVFTNSEFHVYVSKNGNGWAELEYTYAGTAEGRWNVATAEFTLNEVPEYLFIKFTSDVPSSYRIDDVQLFSGNGGQVITLPEEGGGNGGQTPGTPAEGPYASDVAFVCSDDDSANAVYSLGTTKIGSYAVTGFKLSKSKQSGVFTSAAVGVEGDKYLNFYAAGWKGTEVTLYYRVDGGEVKSQALVANDGVSGNAPYTALRFAASDHYSVLLTGLTATSTIEFAMEADFSLKTYGGTAPDIAPRAIVCGVKLSDEPIAGEEIEIPSAGKVTIADAIAAADGATVTIENATVIGVYARGILVEDTTGKLLAYAGAAVDAVVGDVVTVEGSMATYGGLRQIGGTVVVTKTGTTNYAYPTATVMDGAAFDAYLDNPVIQYVEYTGTLTIDGYYYNVAVEGASEAVGSLAYVIEGTVDQSLNGKKIVVKGWTIGFSGGKYVNTMIRSVKDVNDNTPDPDPTPTPDPEQPTAIKATVAEFLNAAEDDTIYELTGTIDRMYREDNPNDTLWGNFYLKDSTGEVLIYGLVDKDGNKYWEASGVKIGDTITIRTIRTSHNDTPQGKNATYVSHTSAGGETPTPTPDPEQPTVIKATVAEFLNAAEDDTIYELTGTIDNVANTDYGNFDLVDATGRVYVYGISDKDGAKVFTSLGLKAGDTLTIRGVRTSYNKAPQMGNGVYVSHVAGAEVEQPENEATLSFVDKANRTSYTTELQVWEQNGITLTNTKGSSTSNVGDYSAPARFYKSSNLKVETEKAMTQIVFACNNSEYATALHGSITSGTVTQDGSYVTVVLPSSAKSFSIDSLGGQVRMNSLTVTFAE